MTKAIDRGRPPLTWRCDVPLLTHPAMLRNLVLLFVIAGFILVALLGGIVALTDGLRHAWPMVGMALATTGGLFVLSVLIILVVFRNRMAMEFVIDDRGVLARIVDRRAKVANRLAVVAGALGRSPATAGAGLLGMSGEETGTAWSGVASASYDRGRLTITLRNDWRPVVHLICTPETYDEAVRRVAAGLAGAARPARRRRNPLWRTLGLTLVVVVAIVPLFGMPYPFEPELFSVIFVLCFSLATVWLIPIMGWPVLAGIAWIVATFALQGLKSHTSLFSGELYTAFGTMDAGEWIGFAIACLGLAAIAAIAVAALRGRLVPLLMHDMMEMSG